MLQAMFQFKQPYDNLWNTALQWNNKNESWLNGERFSIVSELLVLPIFVLAI